MLRPLLAVLALALVVPLTARAATVTTTTGDAKLSALNGWLVWSEPDGPAWRLVGLRHGAKRTFAVAARPRPFDVDLGTDARGRVVATYTRCTSYAGPAWRSVDEGCTIRVLDLAAGRERRAGVPHPSRASDQTPSMRRGRIAFSRRAPSHKDVMQLRLWDSRTRRLTRLPHGPMPTGCPYGRGKCKHELRIGAVTDLDLGDRVLTYVWHVQAPGVVGSGGGSVVLARSLRTGRTVTIGSGFSGEACTGQIDGTEPHEPTAVGNSVWYLQLAAGCEKTYAWAQRGRFGGGIGKGDLPASTLHATTDGRRLYALVAPVPPPREGCHSTPEYRCDVPGQPCVIEALPLPKLRPLGYAPKLPTF